MVRAAYIFLLLMPLAAMAQFTYTLDASIPVQNSEGEDLSLAWAGGLNAVQFNTMDLDGDGQEDLVLFDRMAGKVITFIVSEGQHVPAPEFEELFPEGIYNWVLLRDFNCDGKKDIFTGDVLGIKVYRNVTSTPGVLLWEQHLFETGFSGARSQVLLTENPATGIKVNLQLQFDDLPSINDVDGDGDIDILNIQYTGRTVEFHRNMRVENGLPCDSLEYVRITRAWGNFSECGCGLFSFDGKPCDDNHGGRTQHAGGKSLLTLDINGDQVQDLIFSEAECTRLFALPNNGTVDDPVINSFAPFSEAKPANFVIFPAAYYEDVDMDGKKDLITSPNIFSKEFLNSDLNHSTWFYKNTGTDLNPSFSFMQDDFLQARMIDVGDNAVPAFTDIDGDGDFDMLVSSHSSPEFTSTVRLYENTGSAAAPAFKLVADDFLGFSDSRFFNVKIQIVDINSDQTQDLVFSATHFDTYETHVYYFKNKSQSILDVGGVALEQLDFSLTSSENVYFNDINGDGLPDLLAGRSEGNLEYWKNNGIPGAPSFVLEDNRYLGLEPSPLRQNLAAAVADLDADGKVDLVLADQTGKLSIVTDFKNFTGTAEDFHRDIVFAKSRSAYTQKNLGGKTWPAVVNLFNSNKPAIAVGNILGGIHILKHDEGRSLPEIPEVQIYPNPALLNDVLHIRADRQGTAEIISLLGQQLSTPVVIAANQVYRYTLPPLAAGLYLLKFTSNGKSHAHRFVIQ